MPGRLGKIAAVLIIGLLLFLPLIEWVDFWDNFRVTGDMELSIFALPRQLSFHWLDDTRRPIREGIAEAITAQVFVDENHIYPCVEIAVTDLLDDGTLEIAGRIPQVSATWANGFKPRSLAKSWTGSVGPFVLVIAQRLLDRLKGVESNTPVWIYFYDSSPK